uniref:Diacylglycerol kinase n=1 Tax=Rhabditophanes sp. KR3021 TaxID=114890 RepID=A0AC35TTT8_9BILA
MVQPSPDDDAPSSSNQAATTHGDDTTDNGDDVSEETALVKKSTSSSVLSPANTSTSKHFMQRINSLLSRGSSSNRYSSKTSISLPSTPYHKECLEYAKLKQKALHQVEAVWVKTEILDLILTKCDTLNHFTYEQKLRFILEAFDVDEDGMLAKDEVDSLIYQLVKYILKKGYYPDEAEKMLSEERIGYSQTLLISVQELLKVLVGIPTVQAIIGIEDDLKDDGGHVWTYRQYINPHWCGVCHHQVMPYTKRQGLKCKLCPFFCHESCSVDAPLNCVVTIHDPTKDIGYHHWMEFATKKRCSKCYYSVKPFGGKVCRWCNQAYHTKCMKNVKKCTYGESQANILPREWVLKDVEKGKVYLHPLENEHKPLLVLINPKSGGNEGQYVYNQFRRVLNPRQVYSLGNITPDDAIAFFKPVGKFNILVGGGDGSITWVQEALDRAGYKEDRPPMMVMAIGTGNDLSRSLKCGGGLVTINIAKILKSVEKAKIVYLDRWKLDIRNIGESQGFEKAPATIINNYFSIGVDALVCHRFQSRRTAHPDQFQSRARNKLHYFELSATEAFNHTWRNFYDQISVNVNGREVDLKKNNLEGICFLNIEFIHGGTNMAHDNSINCLAATKYALKKVLCLKNDTPNFAPKDIGDGLIEVVGFESMFHLAKIKTGVQPPHYIDQGTEIKITTHQKMPMQIDGEAWIQDCCQITISKHNRVPMLMKKN